LAEREIPEKCATICEMAVDIWNWNSACEFQILLSKKYENCVEGFTLNRIEGRVLHNGV
jgi:hypothetical protein